MTDRPQETEDDEPETDEERAAVEEGREDIRQGLTRRWEDVEREFTQADAEALQADQAALAGDAQVVFRSFRDVLKESLNKPEVRAEFERVEREKRRSGWIVFWDEDYWVGRHQTKRGCVATADEWADLLPKMRDAEASWDEAKAAAYARLDALTQDTLTEP